VRWYYTPELEVNVFQVETEERRIRINILGSFKK
jgi:hypothetical protein